MLWFDKKIKNLEKILRIDPRLQELDRMLDELFACLEVDPQYEDKIGEKIESILVKLKKFFQDNKIETKYDLQRLANLLENERLKIAEIEIMIGRDLHPEERQLALKYNFHFEPERATSS